MHYSKSKTERGFNIIKFTDDYDCEFNIQISSAVEPHIWLGNSDPSIKQLIPGRGWVEFIEHKNSKYEYVVDSRMHLNPKQSFWLALRLIKFAIFKKI